MRSVNDNLTPAQLIARMQASATAFPGGAAGVPTCPANDATSGECVCPNRGSSSGNQCGTGMVNALSAVKAAQKPIGVIAIPAELTAGSVLDASASVAGVRRQLERTRAAQHRLLSLERVSVEPDRERRRYAEGDHRSGARDLDADHHRLRRQYRCGNRHGAREFRLERGAHIGRDPRDRVPGRLDGRAARRRR